MKNKSTQKNTDFLRDKLVAFFNNSKKNPYSLKDLIKKLGFKRLETKENLEKELNALVREGKIIHLKNGLFKNNISGEMNFILGRVDHVSPRFAYVIPQETGIEDIWIDARFINGAIDGDIVKAQIFESSGRNKKEKHSEGKIIEVVERKRTEFVGTIEISPKFAFVIPDNKKIHFDIFVPGEFINKAEHKQKVIVQVVEWLEDGKNPIGKIKEILGNAGENNTEMHAIMAEYGLPFTFSENVEKAAEQIEEDITKAEIAKRRDFRNVTTFTIDPIDAKDFDDAISVQKLNNGNYEIGVHIADVTHYVRLGTLLEKEAYSRATSVYLVDRVVPMLPEKLSNGLCSLRPNEDKLTFSAVFEMTESGKIMSQWFGKTIIHSIRRFTYEEVQEVLETQVGDLKEEVLLLDKLAKILRKERFKNGSISFETIEIKFKLDENGKPLGVFPKIRKDAHKLVEDFMLLANKKVAEYVYNMKKGEDKNTMVYRTHDNPNPDKLKSLATFAARFGHKLLIHDDEAIASALNKLTEEVEGKPEQNVLQGLAIRCMAKARYTTEADMHFGLAFKHYTHFTSPIRRYPDMMVHRLLFHYLEGGKSEDKHLFEEKCSHSSEREKLAADAERASIKYKQVEFMQSMTGKIFDGIISGMIEHGMFVEIVETKCEGMVRLSELTDDFYELDLDNYRIVGKRQKKMYTLGDTVQVQVKKTDLARRTIDLEMITA
ncbi:MAG TPA: ribonuclease R [Cytophagaceae bacterium]|jgi:ribonuclease R|nr:ribonuclease R [Cytophagaceae bacterium]